MPDAVAGGSAVLHRAGSAAPLAGSSVLAGLCRHLGNQHMDPTQRIHKYVHGHVDTCIDMSKIYMPVGYAGAFAKMFLNRLQTCKKLCTSIRQGTTALLLSKAENLVFRRFACSLTSLNWRDISAFSSCKSLRCTCSCQIKSYTKFGFMSSTLVYPQYHFSPSSEGPSRAFCLICAAFGV